MKRIQTTIIIYFSFVPISYGQIILKEDTIKTDTIQDVTILAPKVRHGFISDKYYVDDNMLQGCIDTYELLDHFPGFDYDSFADKLLYNFDSNICYEINGAKSDERSARLIPLPNISYVEVVYNPPSRYTIEGYKCVVKIILKDDYKGVLSTISNFLMCSPKNGDDKFPNEQPNGLLMYSNKTIDVSAAYGMASINWNYPLNYLLSNTDGESVESAEYTTNNPNDRNGNTTHHTDFSVNWRIDKEQSLYGKFSSNWLSTRHSQWFEGVIHNLDNELKPFSNMMRTKENSCSLKSYLVYDNKLSHMLKMHASFANESFHMNSHDGSLSDGIVNDSKQKITKWFSQANLDLVHDVSNRVSLNYGYMYRYLNYKLRDRLNTRITSKYTKEEHDIYASANIVFTEKLFSRIGATVCGLNQHGAHVKRNNCFVQPQLTLSYIPGNNIQCMVEYNSSLNYPKLYQMSPSVLSINDGLVQKGNDYLHNTKEHVFSLQSVFFDKLLVGAQFSLKKFDVGDLIVTDSEKQSAMTFVNMDVRKTDLFVSYETKLHKSLSWSNTVMLNFASVYDDCNKENVSNVSCVSKIDWWMIPSNMKLSAEYRRQMIKDPVLQGYNSYGQDLWLLTANTFLANNRFNVSISYVPPLHLGVRKSQKSVLENESVGFIRCQDLRTFDNTLLIRVRMNIDTRKRKSNQNHEYSFPDENRKGKGLF